MARLIVFPQVFWHKVGNIYCLHFVFDVLRSSPGAKQIVCRLAWRVDPMTAAKQIRESPARFAQQKHDELPRERKQPEWVYANILVTMGETCQLSWSRCRVRVLYLPPSTLRHTGRPGPVLCHLNQMSKSLS
jgi:hypothetical protein